MIIQYPPKIKGHTISNIILVDHFEFKEKTNDFERNRTFDGFTEECNSRDIFLNVNVKYKQDSQNHKQYSKVIIHEATHNILTKHISEKASIQLDNLFTKKKITDKITKKLFGFTLIKKPKNKKSNFLDRDFWLSNTDFLEDKT